ncbi:terminase, partial [Acinetobacter baumannii]
LNRRVQSLTLREGKSELELRELDSLVAHLVKLRAQHNKHQEKLAEIKYSEGDAAAPRQSGDGEKSRKRGKYKKNDI